LPYYSLGIYLREEFSRPLGAVIRNDRIESYLKSVETKDASLITVGDRTTEYFVSHGHRPKLQIVDAMEKRAKRPAPMGGFDHQTSVRNPAGGIASEAADIIRAELHREGAARLLVDGEEDLLVLPAVFYAKEGTDIFYGQPNEGLVHLRVTPQLKKLAADMLGRIGFMASV
jgi:uncharacterized protein (UPF0218 family)